MDSKKKSDSEIRETLPLGEGQGGASQAVRPRERRVSLLLYYRDVPQIVPLRPGEPIVLGREPSSGVRIQDPSLSREHARFQLSDGEVTVEDLRSRNGTKVAGRSIASGPCCAVPPGAEVLLGSVRVFVHIPSPTDPDALGLITHERFRIALEDEVVRARHYGRPLSVLLVRAAPSHAASHVSQWGQRLSSLLRPVDRVGLYSQHAVEILLSEMGVEDAMDRARSIVAGRAEGDPPLYIGVAPFPGSATNAESLCDLSLSEAQRATAEQPVKLAESGTWLPGAGSPRARANSDPVVESPKFKKVFDTAQRAAGKPITVLLIGDTGVGKEVIARAIHDASPRRSKPMLPLNCGAIPADLVQNTLFGHARGAFTGAIQDSQGVFEAANGGTVLLDEIAELPLAAQVSLLRVLESKHVTRVGSQKEVPVDVRVIAATHRDLEAMVANGTFREDLYWRLNTMKIQIPPLRERTADIEPLAMRFLREANHNNRQNIEGFTPGALALMKSYAWPGNVRALKNAVEHAMVLAESDRITEDDLPERVRAAGTPAEPLAANEPASSDGNKNSADDEPDKGSDAPGESLKERVLRYERDQILEALNTAKGKQIEAAKLLKISLRTLANKIKTLKIKRGGYDID